MHKTNTPTLSDAVENYRSSPAPVEFEVRIKNVGEKEYKEIIANLTKKGITPTLSCTMDFIRDLPRARDRQYKKLVREYKFVDGVRTAITYVEKVQLINLSLGAPLPHIVSVSTEKNVHEFSPQDTDKVRMKGRLSFVVGPWRYDITAVLSFSSLGGVKKDIVAYRNKLFPASLNADNFMSTFAFAEITSYEAEIEYVGKQNDLDVNSVNDLVDSLPVLVDPGFVERQTYQSHIYEIAKYVHDVEAAKKYKHALGMKSLGNQVIALTKNSYYTNVFPPVGYYVTDKTDGVRCIIRISGGSWSIITSSGIEAEHAGGNEDELNNEVTIVEGEIVENKKIYLFECMVFRDDNVSRESFSRRLVAMQDAVPVVNNVLKKSGYEVATKKFTKITSTEFIREPIEAVFKAKYKYETDGIVFVEDDKPYLATRNYKWKPAELNTIDFLALKAPSTLLGAAPYIESGGKNIFILFVGITNDMYYKLGLKKIQGYDDIVKNAGREYFPIQFTPSSNPSAFIYHHDIVKNGNIDGKIVELRYVPAKMEWEFIKTREDRGAEQNYYGNNFFVAEDTYTNYIDPFPVEALWTKRGSYFTKVSGDMYFAPNKYKRYVIDKVLRANVAGAKWVMDAAAGRGADLHRYQQIGVKNMLALDVDSTAIAELIRRKFEFVAHKTGAVEPMNVITMVADLKAPAAQLQSSLSTKFNIGLGSMDAVVCNFAIHYMCDTLDNMRNMLRFVHSMLAPNGVFIFTTMNGRALFDLLSTEPDWFVEEGTTKKYAIKKLYSGKTLSSAGQNISVLLPLSDEMKEEPLANIEEIIKESERIGMSLEISQSFTQKQDMDTFKSERPEMFARLTEDDKFYIGLHQVVSLRRTK
jgi:SAM-dependent methyltransferase